MTEKHIAYVGLGSNLGERRNLVKNALGMLHQITDVKVTHTSGLLETKPLANMEQPKYINAVAEIKTSLSPHGLLEKLAEVENLLGREKKEKWASRTIDMDLLLFDDKVIQTDGLTVPHPQMHLRSFVLKPLCELNPELVHPVLAEPVIELAARLNDRDFVLDPTVPQLISIAGNIGVGKTTLAQNLAKIFDWPVIFEQYDTNPFLPAVYAGKKDLALDSQLYFLTSRLEQLEPRSLRPGKIVLADYLFEKELIYAARLLGAEQLTLYQKLYNHLASAVVPPVLVICLDEQPDECLDRIHKRGRPYEQQIDRFFLQVLADDYDRLFANWKKSPAIRFADFDTNEKARLDHLVNQIKHYTACPNNQCEQQSNETV